MTEIYQHYQTCSDTQCPLFNDQEPLKGCTELKCGECRYQSIHILNGSKYNQKLNGKLHGIYRRWYRGNGQLYSGLNYVNGQLDTECNYINGKMEGLYRGWYIDGQLFEESNYKDGKDHGLFRYWYRDGELWEEYNCVDGKKHGRYREWHGSGELMREINYENGVRV